METPANAAQVRFPAPASIVKAKAVPPGLWAAYARPGFDATLDGDDLVLTRTGVAVLKNDPTAEAMPIGAPIEGQELANLRSIAETYAQP